MKLLLSLFAVLSVGVVSAQDSICVKYTTALFTDDTAENEQAFISAVVNLAVLGNATLAVPGILAEEGGLARYFNGAGNTNNRGDVATKVDFLDGAAQLPNPPSSSNTFNLLSHLYQFFGALLGCTAQGFPVYTGETDMFKLHKFMGITDEEMTYFITQVGLSAAALGATSDDVTTIAGVLDGVFNYRCTPPIEADSGLPDFLVGTNPSICHADDCKVKDADACPVDETSKPVSSPVAKPTPAAPASTPAAAPAGAAAPSGAAAAKYSFAAILSAAGLGLLFLA